jgi:hypothetical protein
MYSPGPASFHSARKNYLGRLPDLGQFSLGLQPVVQVVSIVSSTLLVELIGARPNLVLQFTGSVRDWEVCL